MSGMAQKAAPDTSIVRFDPGLDQLLDTHAPIELLTSEPVFTEGPMWREGRLWFSDEEGGKTMAITPEGKLTVLIDYTKPPFEPKDGGRLGPNAMAAAPDGTVVMCEQYARAVERLVGDPATHNLRPVPFLTGWEGKRFNSPNDLVFAKDGSFYFTDPTYGLKLRDKDPHKELPFNAVFYYKDGKLTPVIKDLETPNGLALSPDGKTLYVNNSGPDMRIVAYPVHADGTVGEGHNLITFTEAQGDGVPDGMKLDAHGNIWSTGPGGIRVITPEGKVLGQIKLPKVAANLAWGEDGTVLYICARSNVYRLKTKTMGLLPAFGFHKTAE